MERFAGHNPAEMKQQETTLRKDSLTIKTKSSLVRDQNQMEADRFAVSSDELTLYLDRNSKNIHWNVCHVYPPSKLILRHASAIIGYWIRKQELSCSPNCGKIVRKGNNGRFFADTDFVK